MLTALAIAGPTASGKSDMACAVAKAVNGEVISVDAGGVYREMDIGTAKPSLEWRRQVRHHLFDIRNPNERFDAGAFCRLAVAAAEDISARGKVPVLAGGTMMYFYLLHRQMHNIPPVAACVRAQVEEEIDKRGTRQMHNELAKVDRVSANNIQTGDSQRIHRALAVWRATGKTLSEWQSVARPTTRPTKPVANQMPPKEKPAATNRQYRADAKPDKIIDIYQQRIRRQQRATKHNPMPPFNNYHPPILPVYACGKTLFNNAPISAGFLVAGMPQDSNAAILSAAAPLPPE